MRRPPFALAGILTFSCCAASASASPATDAATGLPRVPGTTIVETQAPQTLCGVTMNGVQYESDEPAAKAVAFLRRALPGATNWTVPAARMTEFLMPNGKAMVRVLDTPHAGYYVVYGAFSKPMTVSQARNGLKC